MTIRFYNAKILIYTHNFQIFSGELHVTNDRISYIGDNKPEGIKFNREINLNGNLIMPGFKNAHTHSPMTFSRSYADDLPLNEWLNNKIFPMEAKLTAEDIYTFSQIAILEYLSGGITANFDMYFSVANLVEASIDCGFRTVICSALNNFTDSLDIIDSHYKKYNNYNDLISYMLGFHAEYTTNIDLLEGISHLASVYKAPVYAHNSETRLEVDECIKRYGMTPTRLFDSMGIFNYGGGGFHCTYLTNEDIEIFKNRELHVVTNPASNLKLASGIAPIQRYIQSGLNIAIGTDGPASNNSLDMFKEMYLVTALQKHLNKDASACPAETVLHMATIGGARAMGLLDCDVLAIGKKADLTVIDLNMPNMQPVNNIINNIVYSGSKQNIKLTMISGKILYEDGIFHIGQDVEKIYSKANSLLKALK